MKPTIWFVFRSLVVILVALALLPIGASAASQEGEEGEEAANSLSMPVVYIGEGTSATATSFTPATDAASYCYNSVCYVIQGTDSWSADVAQYTTALPSDTYVDWGDNMSQAWADGQFIRIESALYVPLDEPMNGFLMVDMLGETSPLTVDERAALLTDLGLPGDTRELWAVQDGDTSDTVIDPVPMLFSFVTDAEGVTTFQYDPAGDPYAMVDFGDSATFYLEGEDGTVYELPIAPEINQSGKFIYGGQLDPDAEATDLGIGLYIFYIDFDGVYTTPTGADTVLAIVDQKGGGRPDSAPTPPSGGGQGGSGDQGNQPPDAGSGGDQGNQPPETGSGGDQGNQPGQDTGSTEDQQGNQPPEAGNDGGQGQQGGTDNQGGPENQGGSDQGNQPDGAGSGGTQGGSDSQGGQETDGNHDGGSGNQPDGAGEDGTHEGGS